MGTFSHDMKVSDTPILAKSNKELEKGGPNKPCGNCNSTNTICIYSDSTGSIIGYWFDTEYFCRDCGKYTLYSEDYDS